MTRTVILFLFLFIISNFSVSKANPVSLSYSGGDEEYLAFAEVMPEPEGGMGSIIKKIKYPEIA